MQLSKENINQLEELDRLYIKAYETKSIGVIRDRCSTEFLYKLAKLYIIQPRYFSEEVYRTNEWTVIETNGVHWTLKKKCKYLEVKVGLFRKTKVSANYSEEWVVDSTEPMKILSIGGLQYDL